MVVSFEVKSFNQSQALNTTRQMEEDEIDPSTVRLKPCRGDQRKVLKMRKVHLLLCLLSKGWAEEAPWWQGQSWRQRRDVLSSSVLKCCRSWRSEQSINFQVDFR